MKKFILLTLVLFLQGELATAQKKGFIQNQKSIALELLGTYASGVFAAGAAEIGAYDPESKLLFVTNADEETLDIIDISDPAFPFLVKKVSLGGGPNSVDVFEGLVAVAVEADPKQNPGKVQFYDIHGNFLKQVEVGALPDMLTFTKNGNYLVVANEGEPSDDYSNDPEGSVSIINMQNFSVQTAAFTDYNSHKENLKLQGIRIFGPNASVAQDFEPEYITTSVNSKYAFVTLQENNAIAIIDIMEAKVKEVKPLGFKDYNLASNSIDASDRDGGINIKTWPVKGMYLPDAIASYSFMGKEYLVTANEGDSRDYDGFSEEARIRDVALDPTVFPTATDLKRTQNLGRLKISNTLGDTDGDGDFDALYSYGARSFSIWSEEGQLIFDSGNDFENITAQLLPANFNSDNEANGSFDSRSDDKGPEPEGLAIGKIKGKTYAFIGMERIGGIMVYDISLPHEPEFVQYLNNRDFTGVASTGTAGDLGPEGALFISEENSHVGDPMLIVTNEISGTTSIYKVNSNTEEEEEYAQEFSVKAFPNPIITTLTLTSDRSMTENTTIEFTGLFSGKTYLISEKSLSQDGKKLDIDVSILPSGMYVMKLMCENSTYRMNLMKK
jgi:hypothetical protein